ncbi:MAG: hypothetical protein Q6373_025035 [Candidatus Sigynarchaeota archaeon]
MLDERVDIARPRAGIIANLLAGDYALERIHRIVYDINTRPGSGMPASCANKYYTALHYEAIKKYLDKNMLDMMRRDFAVAGGDAFDIELVCWQEFLDHLAAVPAGTRLPATQDRNRADAVQKAFLDAWVAAVGEMLDLVGARPGPMTEAGAFSVAAYEQLECHFQHALLGFWPAGFTRTRAYGTIIGALRLDRLPASVQLARQAALALWGVGLAHQVSGEGLGGWTYTRLRFAPLASPNQPGAEFIARYRPDANIKDPAGPGFEVLAYCTNLRESDPKRRDYAPSGTGGAAGVWAVITGQNPIPDPKFTTIAAYLDSLPRVQVGGRQLPDEAVMDSNGKPTGRLMQNTHWVALLVHLGPR